MQPTLTSTKPEAVESLAQGIDGFNRWRADAMSHIDAAITADPDFVMAHAVKGIFLVGGRNNRFQPMIAECLQRAQAHAADVSDWERGYVRALDALARGQMNQAVVIFEALLLQHPTDLFAHRFLQQELFWMGEVAWMRDVAARAAPAWSPTLPDYGCFLSVRAFGLEETGDYATAERLGREAVERDPQDCWGTHAVAHVLEMQARYNDGIAWLEGLSDQWLEANQIRHHLWWHLSLYYLEQEAHERILALLDSEIRNPDSPLVQAAPDAYIDLQNVASLLLRLELRGVDVGKRWQSVAEFAVQHGANHPSPFTSAHSAMILAASGRLTEAEALIQSMQEFVAAGTSSLAPRVQVAALPAAQAAIAHRQGDYAAVLKHLMPARRDLWRMGGSHAQRDVFTQILVDACQRLGRQDYVQILVEEMTGSGFAKVTERTLYKQYASTLN